MRSCLFALAILSALPAIAQSKHPFTFEDMMALKRVEEPEVSPDGKWVLFAAVDVDLKANTKTPHVWVVPLRTQASQNRGDLWHPNFTHSESASAPFKPGVPHFSPLVREVGYSPERTTGSSTPQDASPSAAHPAPVGMTDIREREIISDQDADRPRWAPDGKRFAFISTKENGSQIWIADFDGETGTVTAKHRLTNVPTEADGELWSPDGKNILFVSNVYPECDGTPAQETACNEQKLKESKDSKVSAQIFTHLLYRHWNGYKESKRSHLFVISVDGNGSSHVGTGGPPVHSSEARQTSAPESNSEEVKDPTLSQKQEWGTLELARDLTPGDYDAPVFSLGGQDDYAFSPDGQEICYASNHDPEPAISTNNDLFTVPVNFPADATSKVVLTVTKDITAENKAADNTPLYSPDGKYIAYRAQQRPGYESDIWRLVVYVRKIGTENIPIKSDFDGWIGSIAWSPDSKHIFLSSENQGNAPIYETDLAWTDAGLVGSDPRQLVPGSNDDLVVIPNGEGLIFTRMSLKYPNKIYWQPLKYFGLERIESGSWPRPLTQTNDTVISQVDMPSLEPFWFTGANNDKVEGFLVKPPNFDPHKKYPVKFLIHGGPQGAWGDNWSYRWNPELFAANGYVVIMINFHGSTGYGQKFIDAINGDWGGAPFEDLMKGLDYAEQHYPFIDKDRECALGASYGGYMTNWILGHTNRFKCIVTHDGMFNTTSAWGTTEELWFNEWEFKGTPYTNRELYRKWSPHLSATNFKTPTLVIHGQKDYRLDVSEGFQLFTTLQRLGVPSKMLYFPDEGHWVLKPQNSQLWYKTVNDWVDQWTKPVAGGH